MKRADGRAWEFDLPRMGLLTPNECANMLWL
ncbi:hypothetical protein ES703_104578 [subsurface metagenome]